MKRERASRWGGPLVGGVFWLGLEEELQAELLLAHVGGCAGDVAEVRGAHDKSAAGVAEVRVVEGVEGLPTELDLQAFGDGEVLEEAPVEVDEAGSAEEVTGRGTIGKRRG